MKKKKRLKCLLYTCPKKLYLNFFLKPLTLDIKLMPLLLSEERFGF